MLESLKLISKTTKGNTNKMHNSLTFVPLMATASSCSSSSSPSVSRALNKCLRQTAATAAITAALLLPPTCLHLNFCACHASTTAATTTTNEAAEHELADEAWKIVDTYFYDTRQFNRADWLTERDRINATRLSSRNVTYSVLRRSISKLNDRYTRLLTPTQMAELRKFDVSGVGLLLTVSESGDFIVSSDPISDTSAGQAGIKHGDIIDTIDGKSLKGQNAFEIAQWMQGKDGSIMSVGVRDKGDLELIRNFSSSKNSMNSSSIEKSVVLNDEGRDHMGYIRLKDFSASSRNEIANALTSLKQQGAKWIVLDLRSNGGGVFEGALEIAGLFQGDENPIPIVQVTGSRHDDNINNNTELKERYDSRVVPSTKEDVWNDVDVAILLNNRSASSSEVLAGGLHDGCKAALIGDQSFGKGLIQGVFGLSDGGGVIVTVGEYQTPKGTKINGIGLQPDMKLKLKGIDGFLKGIGLDHISEDSFDLSHDDVRNILRMCRQNEAQQ